jgi:hypothetical protein
MANSNEPKPQDDLDFIDESGHTSMEPEGTDAHHHHMGGWYHPVADINIYDRWEGRTGEESEADVQHELNLQRGGRPVEGNGFEQPH